MANVSWIRLRWRLHRALAALNPIQVFRDWQYDGYGYDGVKETWRSRVGFAVVRKWNVVKAIVLALCQPAFDDLACMPWWQRLLYRLKTVICLVVGRHWPGAHYEFECVTVAWWDGEMVGYYEPEWEDSHVNVGYGWRNWFVELDVRMY